MVPPRPTGGDPEGQAHELHSSLKATERLYLDIRVSEHMCI